MRKYMSVMDRVTEVIKHTDNWDILSKQFVTHLLHDNFGGWVEDPRTPVPMPFIVFDGVDGVGKTTLLNEVYSRMQMAGMSAVKILPGKAETTEGQIAYAMAKTGKMGAEAARLFAIDRIEMSRRIRPYRMPIPGDGGASFLADRYALSTIVYQFHELSLAEAAAEVLALHAGVERPNVTFLFDLDEHEIKARLEHRGVVDGAEENFGMHLGRYRHLMLLLQDSRIWRELLYPLTGEVVLVPREVCEAPLHARTQWIFRALESRGLLALDNIMPPNYLPEEVMREVFLDKMSENCEAMFTLGSDESLSNRLSQAEYEKNKANFVEDGRKAAAAIEAGRMAEHEARLLGVGREAAKKVGQNTAAMLGVRSKIPGTAHLRAHAAYDNDRTSRAKTTRDSGDKGNK